MPGIVGNRQTRAVGVIIDVIFLLLFSCKLEGHQEEVVSDDSWMVEEMVPGVTFQCPISDP